MSTGTRLDRSNRSEIASGSGAPSSSTRGNIYLDYTNGDLYIKTNSGWTKIDSSLWELSGGEIVNTSYTPVHIKDSSGDTAISTASDGTVGFGVDVGIGGAGPGTIMIGDPASTSASSYAIYMADASTSPGLVDIKLYNGEIQINTISGATRSLSIYDGTGTSVSDVQLNIQNGRIYASDGSTLSPTYSFLNGITSGMYWDNGTSRIAWGVGNSELMLLGADLFDVTLGGSGEIQLITDAGNLTLTTSSGIIALWNNSNLIASAQSNEFIINDASGVVDFRAEGNTVAELLLVDASEDVVIIDGSASSPMAQARLNISNHTWLLGNEIYNLDFTSATYTTMSIMRKIGIKIPGTGGNLNANEAVLTTYNISGTSGFNYTIDITDATWSYLTGEGWTLTAGASGDTGGGWVWPLNRIGNWYVKVTFKLGTMSANDYCFVALCAVGVGGYIPFFTVANFDVNSATYYEPELCVGDGTNTFTTVTGPGTTTAPSGSYTIGLKFENGCLCQWDTSAWATNYVGRFGAWTDTDFPVGANTMGGIDHILLLVGTEEEDTYNFYPPVITNLEFQYLN